MAGLRVGSLFTGTGALDLAVIDVFDAEVVWHSQYEPPNKNGKEDTNQYAAKILARHWPDVPNLWDITKVDWQAVLKEHGPVDILTGGFPCFPAGTLITTSTGLVPIEQVKVGDEVLTHERRWKPVVQTMSRQADHRITVKIMGAPTITTTDEHPFYVRRTRDSVTAEWVKAADLKPGMYAAQQVDEPSEAAASQHDLAVAYLVGRWLGDGWTVTHKRTSKVPQGSRGSRVNSVARRVHWCCSPSEAGELEAAFAAAGIRPTRSDERTVVKYVIQSVEWAERLAPYGRYAHGKQIPESAHRLPRAVQAEILRGWLDSDGDVKVDGTLNGTTTSRALAVGMARIARCVYGKAVSIHENRPKGSTQIEGRSVNQRPWWNVRSSPGPSKRAFATDGFAWVPVRSVVRDDMAQDVFNIGVQDDESYIAEGIVVHNCQDVSSAGKRAGLTADSRSGLWAHFARAIRELNPRLVVIENVEGLLSASADRGLGLDVEAVEEEAGAGRVLRALGAVLGDLATLGFHAEWERVGADDVGAPHRRRRVIIYAWQAAFDPRGFGWGDGSRVLGRLGSAGRDAEAAADSADLGHERGRGARDGRPGSADGDLASADAQGAGLQGLRPEPAGSGPERGRAAAADSDGVESERRGVDSGPVAADADGGRREGDQERDRGTRGVRWGTAEPVCPTCGCEESVHDAGGFCAGPCGGTCTDLDLGRPDAAPADSDHGGRRADVLDLRPGQPDLDWGAYGPAIRRWEDVLGRPAPWPTDALGRLSPVFTEWLMGLPDGWVTDTPGLTRPAMLRALGNGVVWQQAAYALRLLHTRAIEGDAQAAA